MSRKNQKQYSSTFISAVKWLIDIEGGESIDPADRGGHTKYGISKRAYPNVDISALTIEDAIDIYYRDYWLPARCDELPMPLACAVFDSAVNCGVRRGVGFLQQAVDAKDDGIIGPKTLDKVRTATTWHTANGVFINFMSYRSLFYNSIVANDPSQSNFLRGWLRRCFKLQELISQLLTDDCLLALAKSIANTMQLAKYGPRIVAQYMQIDDALVVRVLEFGVQHQVFDQVPHPDAFIVEPHRQRNKQVELNEGGWV